MKNKSKLWLLSLFFCIIMVCAMAGCTNKIEDINDGEFVWLDNAYTNSWITNDDLKSVAFYYNELHYDGVVDYGENFTPLTKNPAELEETIKEKVILSYCKKMGIEESGDVGISSYYGTYGDCIVVEIMSSCVSGGGDPINYQKYELGGVTFYNYSVIGVYKKII